ncbi:transposase family protein, partial [Sphaerotilus natans]
MQDHPTAPGDELMQHFEDLADPRRQTGRFQYPLQELLLTALCAVAAGAE